MDFLIADVRQAFRMLRNNLTFSVVAISALALGIGANTAIFSVVNKVLLEPLPYPDSDRLMRLGRKYPNGFGSSNSIPKYMTWRRNDVFGAMTLYDQGGPGLNLAGDHPRQIKGAHVSADYFTVFGVHPALGRNFSAAEDAPNGPKAVVISSSLWRSHFGADPNVLGKTLILNTEPYSVVGVMPAGFESLPPAEVWIPLQANPNSTNQGHYLAAAGRLKLGVSIEQAAAQMRLRGEEFRRQNPKWMDKTESVAVIPMRDSLVRDVKTALYVLIAAVGFVLLIACANVANLLLARAAARQKELAIRAAIGASRWRVVRQLLTESVILALAGGAFGFLLGAWGVRALLLLVPGNIPRMTDPDRAQSVLHLLDWRVVAFTAAISIVTGILFGLFPALQISSPEVASTLKEANGRSATGRKQNRIRKALVAGEMALALVLLVAAVLLIRTFTGLSTVNPGFDSHHVVTLQTSLAGARYAGTQKVDNFTVQALRRIEAIPGIESAATEIALPADNEIDLPFNISGKAPKPGEHYNGDEQWRSESPHYFKVFKIPLLRGRFPDERDVTNAAPVVFINQAMAKKYWPNEDALGQVITIGAGLGPEFADKPRQIVGIFANVRETGLSQDNVGVMYVPQSQQPEGITQLANNVIPLSWSIRASGNPMSIVQSVQKAIQAVDGQMPVSRIRTMDEVLAQGTSRQNFNMMLLSIFAAIALLLAAIGIYGLMSYAVEQQTQELGIRMALGADRPDLLKLIIRQGMKPALIGVGLGLCVAFGITRLLSTLLYGVKATDPLSFASVAIILSAVALFATAIPGMRAMKLDPVEALREE